MALMSVLAMGLAAFSAFKAATRDYQSPVLTIGEDGFTDHRISANAMEWRLIDEVALVPRLHGRPQLVHISFVAAAEHELPTEIRDQAWGPARFARRGWIPIPCDYLDLGGQEIARILSCRLAKKISVEER